MKTISFGTQCLLALFLGALFGMFIPQGVGYVSPLGDLFIKLLKMIVIPLTFSTIIASFTRLENAAQIRSIGIRTLGWFIFTALLASGIGILVGVIINPGAGMQPAQDLSNFHAREIPVLSQVFLDMMPGNLIEDMAKGKILPVIIFAIFLGIAITLVGEKANTVKTFFSEFSQVMFKVTRWVIRFSPVGIFGLIAPVAAKYGLDTISPLIKFIGAVYLGCLLMLVVYGVLVFFIGRVNPFRFYKAIYPMQVMAFTTSSSLATLPVTMNTLTSRLKISEKIVSFVAPLGSTMKMDGCGAIYPTIVAIFTAAIYHVPLGFEHYLILAVTAAIATIGTAGVPGTASIMATVVLASVGLPLEGLAIVIGIDKIVDMMRTLVNVTGSGVVSLIVARSQHAFDEEAFAQENFKAEASRG